jgi:hypothetical protein
LRSIFTMHLEVFFFLGGGRVDFSLEVRLCMEDLPIILISVAQGRVTPPPWYLDEI